MEHANPLGEEKISRLIMKFSVPAIVGMMVNALYNIVDRIYIGNTPGLGQTGLAGITISFPLMLIPLAIGVLFGIGGATLFSIRLGEKNKEEAQNCLGNAFLMLMIIGTLYMVAGQVFLRPVLVFFGASETILPYAVEYMRFIFLGVPFQIMSMGLNNFMRADGSPKLAMITMFMGAGTNIVLDPLFILVFHMGMAGAAIATSISQVISFIWVLSYFLGKKSKNKLRAVYLKPNARLIARITSLGLPNFFIQLIGSLLNSILNKSLSIYGGDIAVSSMGIINSLQTLMFMPIIGLNQGIQPIISFNFGAEKFDRVKKTALNGIVAASAISFTGFLIIRLFPTALISMFNRDAQLVEYTRYALLAWTMAMPFVGFQVIGANFFQAIGKPASALFLTMTRQAILLIPSLLVFPLFWGIKGLLHAAPFSDILSTVLTGIWFFAGIRELARLNTHVSPLASEAFEPPV